MNAFRTPSMFQSLVVIASAILLLSSNHDIALGFSLSPRPTSTSRPQALGSYRTRSTFLLSAIGSAPAFESSNMDHESSTVSTDGSLNQGPFATGSSLSTTSSRFVQHRDIVIVGGGLAGLSIALYLTQLDPSRHVTVLDRQAPPPANGSHDDDDVSSSTTVASWAAAGMLAPHAERLPQGPLLQLCEESRDMYSDFVNLVESLAQQSGEEGAKYLKANVDRNGRLEPWHVGYLATGGFLAPAFAGDSVATWAPPARSDGSPSGAVWLDAHQVREMEPELHPQVVGGWWFPNDASVDARRLTRCLQAACVAAGVQLLQGSEVTSVDVQTSAVRLKSGATMAAQSLVVANGAWMQQLLPVPMQPHKGQSLSLRMPQTNNADTPPALRRVLFAQDCYMVPKADGRRVIVGATVEAGSWDSNVTPAGLMHILSYAMQLIPSLQDWAVEETWVGLRPTTPDKLPLLGKTPWSNVYLAGGYWRNGVLLAPKTAHLMAQLILAESTSSPNSSSRSLSAQDHEYLAAFAWDRFTNPETSLTVAANARYAAALHPLQQRSSNAAVATAVGTELGSYSTARSAQAERSQDRDQLFGSNDDIFEQAAALGKQDADAYSSYSPPSRVSSETNALATVEQPPQSQQPLLEPIAPTQSFEGSVDALTVGSATDGTTLDNHDDANDTQDLSAVYAQIRANKAAAALSNEDENTMTQGEEDERPDPGFRIYHVDEETGEEWEVPPYTKPADFFEQLQRMKKEQQSSDPSPGDDDVEETIEPIANNSVVNSNEKDSTKEENNDDQYSESTFDGYTVIQKANSRASREEELKAMREARRQNRVEETDVNQVGVMDMEDETAKHAK